jgi:hypothetical protein
MDVSLPAQVRRRTDALVVEYVGYIPPGRIFSVAARTARSLARTGGADADFLARWESHVRLRLTNELTDTLAHPVDAAGQSLSSLMR